MRAARDGWRDAVRRCVLCDDPSSSRGWCGSTSRGCSRRASISCCRLPRRTRPCRLRVHGSPATLGAPALPREEVVGQWWPAGGALFHTYHLALACCSPTSTSSWGCRPRVWSWSLHSLTRTMRATATTRSTRWGSSWRRQGGGVQLRGGSRGRHPARPAARRDPRPDRQRRDLTGRGDGALGVRARRRRRPRLSAGQPEGVGDLPMLAAPQAHARAPARHCIRGGGASTGGLGSVGDEPRARATRRSMRECCGVDAALLELIAMPCRGGQAARSVGRLIVLAMSDGHRWHGGGQASMDADGSVEPSSIVQRPTPAPGVILRRQVAGGSAANKQNAPCSGRASECFIPHDRVDLTRLNDSVTASAPLLTCACESTLPRPSYLRSITVRSTSLGKQAY